MSIDATTFLATDFQADDGSVVRSGILLADAVLAGMNNNNIQLAIDLTGLKGASSSYFNVFLRRIDEGCGLDAFKEAVEIRFDSRVQQMMFDRSYASMKRGMRQPEPPAVPGATDIVSENATSIVAWFRRVLRF